MSWSQTVKKYRWVFITGAVIVLTSILIYVIYLIIKHHSSCKRGYIYSSKENICIPICPKTTPYYDSKRGCIQCRNSNDCKDKTPVCDTSRKIPTCVPCTLDDGGYCKEHDMVCDTSGEVPKCVQCLTKTDCKGETPVCDTSGNRCVPCTLDNGGYCQEHHMACDISGGVPKCVQCLTNSDCHKFDRENPHCNTTDHTCGKCIKNGDCSGNTPFCYKQAGAAATCVQCLTTGDCKDKDKTPVCDTSRKIPTCVPCTLDDGGYCKEHDMVCDTSGEVPKCVQCLTNLDCHTFDPDNPICKDNTCGPCTKSIECTLPNLTVCDAGMCVLCTSTDHTNCKDPTPACTQGHKCVTCTSDDDTYCQSWQNFPNINIFEIVYSTNCKDKSTNGCICSTRSTSSKVSKYLTPSSSCLKSNNCDKLTNLNISNSASSIMFMWCTSKTASNVWAPTKQSDLPCLIFVNLTKLNSAPAKQILKQAKLDLKKSQIGLFTTDKLGPIGSTKKLILKKVPSTSKINITIFNNSDWIISLGTADR